MFYTLYLLLDNIVMQNKLSFSDCFVWTTSGMQLFNQINIMIEENGGREALYSIMSKELAAFQDERNKDEDYEVIIIKANRSF